jgi:16S rRNA (guanine527-N7)-methyltransferase
MERVNLTTVKDPVDMADRLYLDSAILVPHLPQGSRVHDVGTGAGFPGLVCKALQPGMQVTLTEARRKKVSFLRQAVRQMGLEAGLEVCHARVGLSDKVNAALWSDVVSRAAFPPEEWLKVGSRLVAPGGRLWVFSGQPHGPVEPEFAKRLAGLVRNLEGGFRYASEIPYRLPYSGKQRLLVCVQRVGRLCD